MRVITFLFLLLGVSHNLWADAIVDPEPWSNGFRLYIRLQYNSRVVNIEAKDYHLVLQDSLGRNDTIRLFGGHESGITPDSRSFLILALYVPTTHCTLLDGKGRVVYAFDIVSWHPVFRLNKILLLDILICDTHYLHKVRSDALYGSRNIKHKKALYARRFAIACITNGQCCEPNDRFQYIIEGVGFEKKTNYIYYWLQKHYPTWSSAKKARWDARVNHRLERYYRKYE